MSQPDAQLPLDPNKDGANRVKTWRSGGWVNGIEAA
jgi:hypothetical protein